MNRRQFSALPGVGLIAARAPGTLAQEPGGLTIAASTPIIADIVRQIVGQADDVWSVIPVGADPHTWEASPREMVRIGQSNAFISVGAYLEPFIEAGPWRRAVDDNDVPELVLADHLALISIDRVIDHGDHVHDLRSGDPHFWLDPMMVKSATPVIVDFLSRMAEDRAAEFGRHGVEWNGQLDALHAELAADLGTIPEARRKMVVFHDAYTYFAAQYGFEVIGIVMPDAGMDPSARAFAELEQVIVDNTVDVIFVEPQLSAGSIDGLVEQYYLATAMLLTDTFDADVDTYLELMRFNRDSLVQHLG
jgi:ABC-type Zn uptake system ZnuABC Zn-binding protein ZnuA